MDEISTPNIPGRYHLLSLLGKGGMGEVWLAEDPLLLRQVAIKRLAPHHSDDQAYLQRFEREARAAAALHHPHILPLHDYGQQRLPDGRVGAYIVMSYVAGGSLEERLTSVERQGHLLADEEVFSYLTQAAQAIDYAHEQGVLHRDIKPGNMLLREDRTLLLADFGIARVVADTDNNLTQTGMPIGTPRYMAPEQAQGRAVEASDIYSLAILAYRCFTGRYPFDADTTYAVIIQQVTQQPPPPRQFNPTLSPAFEQVLLTGLSKDPAQRPSTALEFVRQLQQQKISVSLERIVQPPDTTNNLAASEEFAHLPAAQPKLLPRRAVVLAGGALIGGAGIAAVAFSPFGRSLLAPTKEISGSATPAAVAKTDGPLPIQIQAVLNKPVAQLTWSPTEDILAVSGQDGQCVLWKFQTDQTGIPSPLVQRTLGSESSLSSLGFAWSPDATMLAVSNTTASLSNPNAILVYKNDLRNLAPGFSNSTITSPQSTRGLNWAPGHSLIVLNAVSNSPYQSSLSVYDPDHPSQAPQPVLISARPTTFTTETFPTALASDGSTLALSTGTADLKQGVLIGKVSVENAKVQWQPKPLIETRDVVTNLAWSPDSHYLAGAAPADVRQVLYIWDATQDYHQLKPGVDLTSISERLNCVAWSPAKRFLLAAGSSLGKVYLWTIQASGASLTRTLPGIAGRVTALNWSHDGRWLAASYDDNFDSVLVWRLG
jgi:serine/threonine protein kinase